MEPDHWDLMCLRSLKVNGESQRVALTAASIVAHAHAIGRDVPDQAGAARRIVELARALYAVMPSRRAVADLVETCWIETAGPTDRLRGAAARARLVDQILHLFHHGRPDGPG